MEQEQVLKLYGEQLKQLRQNSNQTQQELGEKSDSSTALICELEQGKGNPELKTLCKVADKVNADVMIWLRKRN